MQTRKLGTSGILEPAWSMAAAQSSRSNGHSLKEKESVCTYRSKTKWLS
jgi:hypothetical protein